MITLFMVISSVSCVNTPISQTKVPEPDNDGTALFTAYTYARAVGDRYVRASLYGRLAQLWSIRNNDDNARRVLALWAGQNASLPKGRDRYQLDLELARSALKCGYEDVALSYMGEVLTYILSEKDIQVRSTDLAGFIQVCFLDTQATEPLLRRAVQQIYILDDLWLRVYLLAELSGYYESTEGKRAGNFLQQAVPAALGIDNPFLKAEAFALLAEGLKREGLDDDAQDQVLRSIETITDQEILSLSREDSESLTRTMQILIKLNRQNEVASFIDLIPSGPSRAIVFDALARAYLRSGQIFPWRLSVQRMISTLGANYARVLYHLGGLVAELGVKNTQELLPLVNQGIGLIQNDVTIGDDLVLEFSSKIRNGGFIAQSEMLRKTVTDSVKLANTLLGEWPKDATLASAYGQYIQGLLTQDVQGDATEVQRRLSLRLLASGDVSGLSSMLKLGTNSAAKSAFILDVFEQLIPGAELELSLGADLSEISALSQ